MIQLIDVTGRVSLGTPDDTVVNLAERRAARQSGPHASRLLPLTHKVIAVGGGKGGVGKSLVAACLAERFAAAGVPTLAIDADAGGSNLHTYLGKVRQIGIGYDLTERIAFDGPGPLLLSPLYEGESGNPLPPHQRRAVVDQAKASAAGAVVIDLAAGTGPDTLDYFAYAPVRLCVTTPDKLSIENLYRFLRTAVFRAICDLAPNRSVRARWERLIAQRRDPIYAPGQFLEDIAAATPNAARGCAAALKDFQVFVVLNMALDDTDPGLLPEICDAAGFLYGIRAVPLGALPWSEAVVRGMRSAHVQAGQVLQAMAPHATTLIDQLFAHLRPTP